MTPNTIAAVISLYSFFGLMYLLVFTLWYKESKQTYKCIIDHDNSDVSMLSRCVLLLPVWPIGLLYLGVHYRDTIKDVFSDLFRFAFSKKL